MPTILINPLDETPRAVGSAPPRLESLAGKRIALLDISKPGGNIFLDHLERLLRDRHRVAEVLRLAKPTFTRPAPADVLDRLREWQADGVIEALAD